MGMWSAAVDLFEVVALVAVALFLLVGVVVAALRPTPLLGLLLGRLRPPAHLPALAPCVALWAKVCATRGLVTAAAPPALSLGLGLLRRSGFNCSVTLLVQRQRGGSKEEEMRGQLASVDQLEIAKVEKIGENHRKRQKQITETKIKKSRSRETDGLCG